jgi:hypothetical protein
MSEEAIMAIDIGSQFQGTAAAGLPSGLLDTVVWEVTVINGTNVTVKALTTSSAGLVSGAWLELVGCRDSNNNPLLPQGLAAWAPSVGNRTGSDWNTYIAQPFNGVIRSANPDRLAGQFTIQGTGESLKDSISRIFRLARRAGCEPDIIAMNDRVFAALLKELTPTYFAGQEGGKGKKATIGQSEVDLEFASSYLDYIVDDPYCPADKIYVFDKSKIEFAAFNNLDKIVSDGVGADAPGKADPLSENSAGYDNIGTRLNIDDFISIEQGEATQDGPCLLVATHVYGNIAVYDTASIGCLALTTTY